MDMPIQETQGETSSMAVDYAIELTDIAKSFKVNGEVIKALDSTSFVVPRKQFVSVIGPSGCGKSTLLRMIGGLIVPDSGAYVKVEGQEQSPTSRNKDLGIVFQTDNMLPWKNMRDNIRLAGVTKGLEKSKLDERVCELVKLLGLQGFEKSYPHQLSGGMRQRAALGQAFATTPRILLLDEPFGALDALTRDKLNVELLRLWERAHQTVILVTHSISEAVFLSDRIFVMSAHPGRIIKDVKIGIQRPRQPDVTRSSAIFGQYIVELEKLMGVF